MLSALRNFAITFLVSLLIFGGLAYCLTKFAMTSFADGFTGAETETETVTEAVTESVFNPFDDPVEDSSTIQGSSFSFLLVGLDYQPEKFEDYSEKMPDYIKKALEGVQEPGVENLLTYEQKRDVSADAILIGRVDKEDRRLVLTALPGSTHVLIDGVYTDLGSVPVNKGMDFFIGKVTALTGFVFDYYAVVNLPAMESIINRLGGLSFKVPCDMEYEDPEEGLKISLKAGTQWLSGETAMQVLRYVSYEDTDISRMRVVRDMASAFMTSIRSFTTFANAPDLYKSLKSGVSTNMSVAEFSDHLDLIFKLDDFSVVNYPYPGKMITENGEQYFAPDITAAIGTLMQYKN